VDTILVVKAFAAATKPSLMHKIWLTKSTFALGLCAIYFLKLKRYGFLIF